MSTRVRERWSKFVDGRLEKCLPGISPNPKSLRSNGCAADPPALVLGAERSFQSSFEGGGPSTWTCWESGTFCGHWLDTFGYILSIWTDFLFFLPSLGSQAFLGNTKRLISVQTRRGKRREETQTVYKPFHLSQGVQQVATLNRLRVLSL